MDDHESQHHHLKQNKGKNNDYDDNIDSNNSTDDHDEKSNAIPLMIMTTICRRWGIRSFTYSILLLCSHTPWLMPYSCPTSKFNHWHHWELHYCRSCWLSWWLFWKLIWTYSSISITNVKHIWEHWKERWMQMQELWNESSVLCNSQWFPKHGHYYIQILIELIWLLQ